MITFFGLFAAVAGSLFASKFMEIINAAIQHASLDGGFPLFLRRLRLK
jgi:hypothetical protein